MDHESVPIYSQVNLWITKLRSRVRARPPVALQKVASGGPEDHWIRPLLRELGLLGRREKRADVAAARRDLERSGLLTKFEAIRRQIESAAGYPLLDEQIYLPPHRRVCRYLHKIGYTEYIMEVLITGTGPCLAFFSRKEIDPAYAGRKRSVLSYFRPSASTARVTLPLNLDDVSDADLREWFSYLLSAFQDKFLPSRRNLTFTAER